MPPQWLAQLGDEKAGFLEGTSTRGHSDAAIEPVARMYDDLENLKASETLSHHHSTPYSAERFEAEQQLAIERTQTIPIIPKKTSDGIVLVDWYTTDDSANPHNWARWKRAFVTFLICAYTWVVYTGSSIYVPSEGGVMDQFGVSATAAALPLALYVLFSDMYSLLYVPYQLSWWVFAAWGGPSLGPLMAGFSVSAENWRWSLWYVPRMSHDTAMNTDHD